jgi:aspartate 1-decarboxylase
VDIWNKNSGARLSTYVIYGAPGSRCCVLNGAASRTCQVGDELIIAATAEVEPPALYNLKPRILTFTPKNEIDQELYYEVFKSEARAFDFRIVDPNAGRPASAHNYANVDVRAMCAELRKKGFSEAEVATFVEKFIAR